MQKGYAHGFCSSQSHLNFQILKLFIYKVRGVIIDCHSSLMPPLYKHTIKLICTV